MRLVNDGRDEMRLVNDGKDSTFILLYLGQFHCSQ